MAEEKTVSRQRQWQIKMVEQGKCKVCGGKLKHYKVRCDSCAKKHRLKMRKAGGYKAHSESGLGKKPVVKD